MAHGWSNQKVGVDSSGCLTEQLELDGQTVVVHYDDVPDSDITTVRGIAITTPLRTVIDIAPDLDPAKLEEVVRSCLDRGLFSVHQAATRIAQPDMASRRGAEMLRRALRDGGYQ